MTSIKGSLLKKLDVNAIIDNTDRKVDISGYEEKVANFERRREYWNGIRREVYYDEEARLKKKAYRQSHREQIRAYEREYRKKLEYKEKKNAYERERYAKNRERELLRLRAKRAKKKAERLAQQSEQVDILQPIASISLVAKLDEVEFGN